MPARFIFTPAAIPPNPAPTTATLGVPAEPNRSSAAGFIGSSLQLEWLRPDRGHDATVDGNVDPVHEARLVRDQEGHHRCHFLRATLAPERRVLHEEVARR